MEFSYRISEEEYLNAAKLRLKGSVHFGVIAAVMFCTLILLLCLVLFFGIVLHHPSTSHTIRAILVILVPGILYVCALAYLFFRALPMSLRRRYRKNPTTQGQYSVNITPESISIENNAGSSSKVGWNLCDSWLEGKELLLLKYRSGAFFPMNLAGLSDAQRDELRGILTAALPKK